MTRALGVMEVPAPLTADDLHQYQTGALRDGGLWTALRRLSDHDHSGGHGGAPITGGGGAIPPEYVTDTELALALAPYATDTEVAALQAQVATLQAQVATLQAQMTGHTHTSGTIDAMGGPAVMP